MKIVFKRLGFGAVLWVIPYLAAVPLLGLQKTAPFVFKSLEATIGALTAALLIAIYFRAVERGFLREAVLLATTLVVLNWLLDIMALLPLTHQTIPQYFAEIGIEYLAFGAFVIVTGYLLGLKAAKT
jgi:uncharacterized membrane protein